MKEKLFEGTEVLHEFVFLANVQVELDEKFISKEFTILQEGSVAERSKALV